MSPNSRSANEHATRRGLFGWVMFDWATQPFYTLVVTFLFVDLLDTAGTLTGVGSAAGFIENHRLPRARLAFLADGLGTSMDGVAEGILAVADTAMERALRVISVERGYDPAEFAVVAFGGAGALHVAELTRRLGAARALVPPDPGLLSAYGMLASPVTREASRTILTGTDDPGLDQCLDRVGRQTADVAQHRAGILADPVPGMFRTARGCG